MRNLRGRFALPPGHARQLRAEHDDRRGGALPTSPPTRHCGTVTGRCAPRIGVDPFEALVGQVMRVEPYASAEHVFWNVEGSSIAVKPRSTGWPRAGRTAS